LFDKNAEDQIAHHPLMIAELHKQQTDIRTLQAIQDLTSDFLTFFRSNATAGGKSNIGIR